MGYIYYFRVFSVQDKSVGKNRMSTEPRVLPDNWFVNHYNENTKLYIQTINVMQIFTTNILSGPQKEFQRSFNPGRQLAPFWRILACQWRFVCFTSLRDFFTHSEKPPAVGEEPQIQTLSPNHWATAAGVCVMYNLHRFHSTLSSDIRLINVLYNCSEFVADYVTNYKTLSCHWR